MSRRRKNDAPPAFDHFCCAVRFRAAAIAGIYRHFAQLYRPLRHCRRRPGAADRRRRPDFLRPGRLCRPRRLHHRLADHRSRRVAVADAADRCCADSGGGALPRFHHPAHGRSLFAAGDDCLGDQPLLPVRQRRVPRRPYRDHRHPDGVAVRLGIEIRTRVLLPDLAGRAAGDAERAQPARFAGRPVDPRAQGRRGDGRGDGGEYAAGQDRDLPDCGGAGGDFRLALRPPATLRQSDPVLDQPRHRIPVHGGDRRRRSRLGCGPWRRADHRAQAMVAGFPAALARPERQFRDHRLRHRDGADPAARPRWFMAGDPAPAAAAEQRRTAPAGRRRAAAAPCTASAGQRPARRQRGDQALRRSGRQQPHVAVG